MITLQGTGKRSQALRELQTNVRQLTATRVPNANVSVHPLGTAVEPGGKGEPARRQNTSPNVPRYG
jgi:hypothetical protein